MITSLNDALSVAERREPSNALLKYVADHAWNELGRRHPEAYRTSARASHPPGPGRSSADPRLAHGAAPRDLWGTALSAQRMTARTEGCGYRVRLRAAEEWFTRRSFSVVQSGRVSASVSWWSAGKKPFLPGPVPVKR